MNTPKTAAALGCALGLLFAACDQPAPKCNVAHGPFWAKYTLVSGEGDCATLKGEQLDVQSYFARRSDRDDRPDYDRVSIAIQPMTITAALANAAGIEEPASEDTPYALGRFVTAEPNDADFCVAPKLSEARLRLAAVPEHELDMCTVAPAAPAYDVRYQFENVRVYYTAAAIGTQFAADLTYTQDGCTARYRVDAVTPVVSCGMATPLEDAGAGASDAAVSDEDAGADDLDAGAEVEPDAGALADAGDPCPPAEPPTGPPVVDYTACENAGFNPDFAVSCDPATMMCALEKRPPSLR